MDWYIPITMLPGIGLVILSTSNLLIALNDEIRDLNLQKEKYSNIIQLKLIQLKRLNMALVEQYICVFMLIAAGVLGGISAGFRTSFVTYAVVAGSIILSVSIGTLIVFAVVSISIRRKHLAL
ncbi:MAG: hypothetical protein GXO91_03195 [FCB group bacterium]|nr:hypothetical protein [FCB group bacterium]